MGNAKFDQTAYRNFTASTATKSTSQIYTSRSMDSYLDPKNVKIRESRDSAANPNSTPIIIGLDVTGSMGILADNIAREGLGTLFRGIFERHTVPDPHILFAGIGDMETDQAPLQISQFEADANTIVDQLTKLWLEGHGGGNHHESYHGPWYMAAFRTKTDAYEKRAKRGYLFTVGDEPPPTIMTSMQIKKFLGDDTESGYSAADLLEAAQRYYDVFHVIIGEGSYASSYSDKTRSEWQALLPERTIWLSDHAKLAETVISAIEVAEGASAADSASRWGDSHTTAIVQNATKLLKPARQPKLLR